MRDKVRLYQSIGGSSPQEAAENAVELRERFGFNACKMSPHNPGDNQMPYNEVTRTAGERVGAVREAVGPYHDIAVDIHARYFEVQRAIRVAKEIEPYYPFWLEEPIRPENPDAMKKLADHVSIPLASGECNYTKFEFRDLINIQALDVVQPDVCVCGGIMEMKKIAAMAEAQYMMVAPHNPDEPAGNHGEHPFRRVHAQLPDPRVQGSRGRRATRRARRAAYGERRLCRHPEQARLGSRVERRGVPVLSAQALEANDWIPGRWLGGIHLAAV